MSPEDTLPSDAPIAMLTAIKTSHMAALSFPLGGIGQEDLCRVFVVTSINPQSSWAPISDASVSFATTPMCL